MRRRLRGVLLAVSLILSILLAILWIRSYFKFDLAGRQSFRSAAIGSYRGHLLLFYWREDHTAESEAERWGHLTGPVAEADTTWEDITKSAALRVMGFGFAYSTLAGPPAHPNVQIFAPDWFLELVVGWAALRLTRSLLRKRHRQRLGLCLQCGYDLHATPERCPECGAACEAAGPAGVSPAAGD